MARRYAFFDLDHTLLPYDTQALFCRYVLRREGWRRLWLLWFLPCVPLSAVGILPLRTMKRLFLGYLWGMSRERLEEHVEGFLGSDFAEALYPEVVAEVERHRAEGRVLVLNSASPEFYLRGIARRLGFDEVFGTKVVVPERMPWLPAIEGPNNKHGEKIEAMRAAGLVPDEPPMLADSWSYSDSSADLPLLELAEHAVMIHPGKRLAAIGAERSWRTMTPTRPYAGKWGGRLAMIRQVLG
ncbi:MAG TPA: HAD-IB family hydrolase, partial [Bacteroidia bacterium]|nr:HAD-IB family hydrolase [Bacteroidia bacterium]